jgi:cyclic-di-GMP phosphodiesterase TipF (flagellum assembly factor)
VLHGLVEQLYAADSAGPPRPRPPGSLDRETLDPSTLDEDPAEAGVKRLPTVGARPVSELGDDIVLDIVRDALRQNRVDLYLQPIVTLPQRKRRYFESFIHLRSADGAVIAPADYATVARAAGLTLAVDNMLLFRSVQLLQKAQQHNYSTAFFCNISPNTFADRKFFADFIEYLETNREMAPSIVFQFAQADLAEHAETAAPDLKRLVDVGYRLCMNAVTDLNFDPSGLAALGFTFVKIDAGEIVGVKDDYVTENFRVIKKAMDDAGVDLIIEGIETEQTLIELLDYNIDLGQGYLFGEPRVSKEPANKSQTPELRVV